MAYDIKGNKTENQYFPIAGANLTGKEVYKYDDKGNISEMTLVNDDGSLVSKEVYKYEFDFAGNWNRMTTSVAVIEAGKVAFEPTEVTYRSIMYYLDENMMRMAQPAAGSRQSRFLPRAQTRAASVNWAEERHCRGLSLRSIIHRSAPKTSTTAGYDHYFRQAEERCEWSNVKCRTKPRMLKFPW